MKHHYTITLLFLGLFQFLTTNAQPFAIGETSITFQDPARSNRNIPTDLFYPAANAGTGTPILTGPFPIVVFGHGAAMDATAFTNIKDFLVPEGYIVAMPNTEASLFPAPNHADFGDDLAFLVTALQNEGTNTGSLFFGAVAARSAIMGHSMGGGCTFLAASGNSNIHTVVGLAPAETTTSAIAAAANVSVPTLVIAAEDECVLGAMGSSVTEPFDMYNNVPTSTNCKIYTEIVGGTHCNFTNGNGTTPFSPAFSCYFGESSGGCSNTSLLSTQQARMEALVLPWLDAWLRGNCTAINTLQTTLTIATDYINTQQVCSITPPVAMASVSNPLICLGNATQLNATGGLTYQWDNVASLDNANIATPIATPSTSTTYTVTITDANGCLDTDQIMVTINPNCPVVVQCKVYLEAAYTGGGSMNTLNNIQMPVNQPFNVAPWNYNDGGIESGVTVPTNAVDWVLLEIRDGANISTIVQQRAAFVLDNGDVVDVNGTTVGVNMNMLGNNNNYYVVIRSRNHLAVQSKTSITPNAYAAAYDFTSAITQAEGSGQMVDVGGGIAALHAGDLNANGIITVHDFNVFELQLNSGPTTNVYHPADADLDGNVTVSDFNTYQPNASLIGISSIRYP